MSITHISRVLAHAPVRGSYLNLLIVIANYANDQGIAWPKVETIAEGIRLGDRQAQRIIAEMRDYGMLYVQPGTGRGHSNRYCVLVGMEPSLIPDHLARCFPKHLDDVRAFCTSQGLHFPTTNSEKGDTSTALPAQNQTGMSPFPDQIGDEHVTLSDQNQTDMSPFVPQTETGVSPFPDQIGDGHVTLSDQNQTDMSPFLQAPEQKGDIAMSNEPSWNPCVVVDDVVQQSVSKQETQPDEHKQATQPNKHKQEIQPDTDTQAAQPNKRKQETQSNTDTHEHDLVAYLKSRGMSAAAQFADIPYEVGRADFDARRADGIPVSHIVTCWREQRPTQEVNYLQAPPTPAIAPPSPPAFGSQATNKNNQPYTRSSRSFSENRSSPRFRAQYSDTPIPDPKQTAAKWGLTLGG